MSCSLSLIVFPSYIGADPWIGDAEGLTALHYAARHNRCEVGDKPVGYVRA
jgi:ankyrin repeat protein